MPVIHEKSIKIKSVIGEPKGIIMRAIKDGKVTVDEKTGMPEDGQAVPLCFVIGRARDKGEHGRAKMDPSTGAVISNDKWPVLLGDFECIPVDSSRDTHRAPKAFLAEHIIESVATLLADLRREGEIDPIVEIAVRVDAVTEQKASTGFTYRWTPLREEAPRHDPLADMRKLAAVGNGAPQIEHKPGEGEEDKPVAGKGAKR